MIVKLGYKEEQSGSSFRYQQLPLLYSLLIYFSVKHKITIEIRAAIQKMNYDHLYDNVKSLKL